MVVKLDQTKRRVRIPVVQQAPTLTVSQQQYDQELCITSVLVERLKVSNSL